MLNGVTYAKVEIQSTLPYLIEQFLGILRKLQVEFYKKVSRSEINLFADEKVFQIIGIVLATERSIKSFTFMFLGFCLNFKSTFTIKEFMSDFLE